MAGLASARPILEARHLYRFFRAGDEETLALRGVSLSVRAGEILAVTGPSGSGKSTLLACLAGLDEPAGGTVSIAGTRMSHRPESERSALRARKVGLLFQSANLFEHLTLIDNIALAQRIAHSDGTPPPRILERVGLANRGLALPSQLSGGEIARAGIAVALANNPVVLLADEPTGELDGSTADRLLGLLRSHADRGCAVVVVTHSAAIVAHADRAVALHEGRVLE